MDAPDRQRSAKPCSPSNAAQLTSERSSDSSSKASRLNPSRISMLLPNANLAAYSKRVSSEVTKRVAEKFVAPGPSQVLLLAHSIAAKGHRGLSQAAEASASLTPTSRIKLMQVLCGIVVMVHAFLLPYRAVFSMLGLDAEERALDSKYFVSFAMTLYPLDALFILFRAAPHISRVILERQQLLAQAMLQNALSLFTPVTEEQSDDEGDTQEANSYAPSDDNICAAGVGGSAKSLPSGCKRPSSAISVQQQWLESACAKSEDKAGTGAQEVAKSEHGAGPAHHAREESDLSTSMRSHEKSTPLLSFSFKTLLLLACILPWDLIPLFAGASVRTWCETQVLRVVRLYWCFPAADALAWLLRYRGHTSVARARLLSFIPLLFLVLHLITCAWQAAGDDVTGQSGWQTNDVLLVGRLNDTSALYLRGIWWTSVTFVTIGFGDIVPTQLSEMNICIFVEYVGLLTACVIVGLLTADITATDVMASSWQQRVDTASSFARSRKLSRKVSQRIHQYLQYQWTYLRGVDEASFFVGLPAALRSEVLVALNDHLIRNIPYFKKGSDALIAQLAGLLFPLLFLPEECLYSEGQSAVYTSLVVRGKVQEIKYVKMQERKRMGARPWSPRNWTPRPSVHYGSPQSMSKASSKRNSSDSAHVCTGRAFGFGFPRMRSISGEHVPSRRNLEEGVIQSPTVDNKTSVLNAAENDRNGQREVEASDEGRGAPSDVEVAARREKKAASTSGAIEAGLQSEASSPCLVARHRSISAQPDVPGGVE
ncbi:hypothetical protein AB1Y20_022452 [Prymnesium parvum]|uniref:Potassium channel domain-containing protein n=1 Tax=Prymnesium parvum TaxID=97485 RepID=A0AB34JJK7_PRYPA